MINKVKRSIEELTLQIQIQQETMSHLSREYKKEEKKLSELEHMFSLLIAKKSSLEETMVQEATRLGITPSDDVFAEIIGEDTEKHKKVGGPLSEAIEQYKMGKEARVLSAMAKIDSSNNKRKMSPAEKELVTHAATSNLDIDPDKFFNFMKTVQSFPNKKGFKPADSCNVEHLKTGNTIVSALESDSSEDNDLPPIKKPGS